MKTSDNTNIVFIIGTGRCGSRLLLNILESNKKFKGYINEANRLWHPKSYPFADRCIETPSIMEDGRKFTEISIKNWPKNHEEKIKKVFKEYVKSCNYDTIFIRSMMISFMIPQICELFPKCKFIHILRNGMAVVESFLRKEWDKYSASFDSKMDYMFSRAKNWNDSVIEIEKNIMLDDSRFLEVKYEDICGNFEISINNIAEFLKIDNKNFSFDKKNISNMNYKMDIIDTSIRKEIEKIMYPVLKLKGYVL